MNESIMGMNHKRHMLKSFKGKGGVEDITKSFKPLAITYNCLFTKKCTISASGGRSEVTEKNIIPYSIADKYIKNHSYFAKVGGDDVEYMIAEESHLGSIIPCDEDYEYIVNATSATRIRMDGKVLLTYKFNEQDFSPAGPIKNISKIFKISKRDANDFYQTSHANSLNMYKNLGKEKLFGWVKSCLHAFIKGKSDNSLRVVELEANYKQMNFTNREREKFLSIRSREERDDFLFTSKHSSINSKYLNKLDELESLLIENTGEYNRRLSELANELISDKIYEGEDESACIIF